MVKTLEIPAVTPLILPPAVICHSSSGSGHRKHLKTYERTGNVFENKRVVQKLIPPVPSVSKEVNFKLPSSNEEGWGWCDFASLAFFVPWRETGVCSLENSGNKARMSMKTNSRGVEEL